MKNFSIRLKRSTSNKVLNMENCIEFKSIQRLSALSYQMLKIIPERGHVFPEHRV